MAQKGQTTIINLPMDILRRPMKTLTNVSLAPRCFRSIFLNVYDCFPTPQRILTRFSYMIFPFKIQKSCEAVISITQQSLEGPATSTRGSSNRRTAASIRSRTRAEEYEALFPRPPRDHDVSSPRAARPVSVGRGLGVVRVPSTLPRPPRNPPRGKAATDCS